MDFLDNWFRFLQIFCILGILTALALYGTFTPLKIVKRHKTNPIKLRNLKENILTLILMLLHVFTFFAPMFTLLSVKFFGSFGMSAWSMLFDGDAAKSISRMDEEAIIFLVPLAFAVLFLVSRTAAGEFYSAL